MNKEEPYRDQAERLRQKVEEFNEEKLLEEGSLPPRRRVHHHKKKKTRLKLKYPVIRILVLFFILLPIVSYSIYTINQSKANEAANREASEQDQTVEHVQVEDNEDEEEPLIHEDNEEKEEPQLPASEKEPLQAEEPEKEQEEAVVEQEKNEPIELSEKDQPQEKFLYHKVQSKETLYSISKKYYNSGSGVEKIKRANGLRSNDIYAGQTLKIPAP